MEATNGVDAELDTGEGIPNLSLEEYLHNSLINSPTLTRLKSKAMSLKNELYFKIPIRILTYL